MARLETIAFDIETTGFEATDLVTVIGFRLPLGVRIFCNTNGQAIDTSDVDQQIPRDVTVAISTYDHETALLHRVREFTIEHLRNRDRLLVAYNGDTWRAGFDLPFLRSRCALNDVDWLFSGMPYADVMELFEKRFNTTHRESTNGDLQSQTDLESTYEVLIGGDYGEIDPYSASSEAVDAWKQGDFESLILHNVADVLRTQALAELADDYCSKSDIAMKSLTAVNDDTTLQPNDHQQPPANES